MEHECIASLDECVVELSKNKQYGWILNNGWGNVIAYVVFCPFCGEKLLEERHA